MKYNNRHIILIGVQFLLVFLISFFYKEILNYFNCSPSEDQLFGISSYNYIYLLYLIPFISIFYLSKISKHDGSIKTSSTQLLEGASNNYFAWINHLLFTSKLIALGLFIIALSRPQLKYEMAFQKKHRTEGINIMISLDASASMLAEDFKPNRFEAAKKVAIQFAKDRPNDQLGLVVFEGAAYTQCPLTSNFADISNKINKAKTGLLQRNPGTAIAEGLLVGVNRLKECKNKGSRVLILLTDGKTTAGKLHPITAAEIAKNEKIKIYTIGVGTNGKAKTPVAIDHFGRYIYDYQKVEIDEKSLKEIAKLTGGKYYRATNNEKLKKIYNEINLLEKAEIPNDQQYEIDLPEKGGLFTGLGLLLLLAGFFTKNLIIKTIH